MSAAAGTARRAIVVVNYGSHLLLEQSLPPLDLHVLGARVVVVDNLHSAAERTAVTAAATAHGWTLVPMETNTGFGHAANAGVDAASALGCEAFVLLNPDAHASTEALGALFDLVERERMTLAAPTILRGDGTVWFAGARVDVAAGRTRSAEHVEDDPDAWLTGACLAAHADLWRAVGGFDPDYFLYWEDVDLSWRAARAGGRLTVLPDVHVVHDVGGTQRPTAGAGKSSTYMSYNCRNRLLFAAKQLPARARLRWLVGSAGYAAEVLQRGGRRALAHDPWRLGWAAAQGTTLGALAVLRSLALPGGRRSGSDPEDAGRGSRGRLHHRRVRLYESVRTAHLERAHVLTPASIVYGDRRYDFDPSVAEGLDLVHAGLLRTATVLWRSDVEAVEVNEPLMVTGLRRAAVAIAVLRLRHRGARVVSYAIENKAPAPAGRGPKAVARGLLDRVLRRYVWQNLDRLAYGTQAAVDLYADLLPARGTKLATAVFPAVPEPCGCGTPVKDPARVIFLGALVERKGFPLLMQAWPAVTRERPDARLLVVGKGELAHRAREWAATDSSVSLDIDPPRERIHAHLRDAAALVLPSQPTPTWREQVGLPIVEGLAHGCAVVTTTQTGLASWLTDHGHEAIDDATSADDLAAAIVRVLDARRTPESVLADLPTQDSRLAADRWLFSDDAADAPGAGTRPEALTR